MNLKFLKIIPILTLLLYITSGASAQKDYTGHIKYSQIKFNGLDTLSAGLLSKYQLFYKNGEITYWDLQERTPIVAKVQTDEMSINMTAGTKQTPKVYSYQNLKMKALLFNESFGPGAKLSVTDNMNLIAWKISKNTRKIVAVKVPLQNL